MGLIEDLRIERKSIKRYSEEEIYQRFLHSAFTDLVCLVRERAISTSAKTVSGEYSLFLRTIGTDLKYLERMDSNLYSIMYGDYGPEVLPAALCTTEIKHGFVSTSAKCSLTPFGKRLTEDLARLGKKEGIKVWFTPQFSNSYGKKDLAEFDVFEKVGSGGSCTVIIHYEVRL